MNTDSLLHDLCHGYATAVAMKKTRLAKYVFGKLHKEYMANGNDIKWLNYVDNFLGERTLTNANIVDAMNKAIPNDKQEYLKLIDSYSALIDPWELLIDTGICDTSCKPI